MRKREVEMFLADSGKDSTEGPEGGNGGEIASLSTKREGSGSETEKMEVGGLDKSRGEGSEEESSGESD